MSLHFRPTDDSPLSVSMFPQDRRGTPREVTVWELLVWTYREQRAHRYLVEPGDWFQYMVDVAALAGEDAPRPKLHVDAVVVHGVVLEQLDGEAELALLIRSAAAGVAPERSDTLPRVVPVSADRQRDRYGWAIVDGRRIDYRIEVVERIAEQRPTWRKLGRGRKGTVGTETVIIEVECCPIEYWPDPSYVRMVDAVHQRFAAAVDQVAVGLRGVDLKRHVLVE